MTTSLQLETRDAKGRTVGHYIFRRSMAARPWTLTNMTYGYRVGYYATFEAAEKALRTLVDGQAVVREDRK